MAGIASFKILVKNHGDRASVLEYTENYNNDTFKKVDYPNGVKRVVLTKVVQRRIDRNNASISRRV